MRNAVGPTGFDALKIEWNLLLKDIGAGLGDIALPIIKNVLPAIKAIFTVGKPILSFLADNFNYIAGAATALGVAILFSKAALIAQGIAAKAAAVQTAAHAIVTNALAIKTGLVTAATSVWTGVQWLLNAAFAAFPIALIVIGIGALIAAIIYVVEKTIGWKKIWDALVGAFQWSVKSIGDFYNTVVQKFPIVGKIIEALLLPFTALAGAIDAAGKALGLWGGENKKLEAPLKKTATAAKDTAAAVKDTGKSMTDLKKGGDDAGKGLNKTETAVKSVGTSAKESKKSLSDLTSEMAKLASNNAVGKAYALC
jgi:methyl-accepting chemotaxis protein